MKSFKNPIKEVDEILEALKVLKDPRIVQCMEHVEMLQRVADKHGYIIRITALGLGKGCYKYYLEPKNPMKKIIWGNLNEPIEDLTKKLGWEIEE